MPILPEIPKVELEIVGDHSTELTGFLTLRRYDLVVRSGGETKGTIRYDLVDRKALDAAVMAAHFVRPEDGVRCVFLRTAVRPPIALRAIPLPDGHAHHGGVVWELPAGLIEPGEDPAATAARELDEELGFAVTDSQMKPLGHWGYPAPGFVGEIHFFFHVEVDPALRKAPGGDGSPLEEVARIVAIPLTDALNACDEGIIRDEKTELALRRLGRVFGS